jgi:hypothetical protein
MCNSVGRREDSEKRKRSEGERKQGKVKRREVVRERE